MAASDLFNLGLGALRPGGGGGPTETAGGRAPAAGVPREVAELEGRVDKLNLVCMAMWSLIQDKTKLTEGDLLERVRTLDLMDGIADGKATRTVSRCARCDRVMSPRHRRCLYCGAEKLVRSAFDAL